MSIPDEADTSVFLQKNGALQPTSYSGSMSRALIEGYESTVEGQEYAPVAPKPIHSLVSRPPTVQAGKVNAATSERMFREDPGISHLVILDNRQRPVGLLTSSNLHVHLSGTYGYALFANKLVDSIASSEFIVAKSESPVSKVAAAAMSRAANTLYDPILIVDNNGCFVGSVTVKDLLDSAETAIVEAKHKAEITTRLKSEFLSAMSHEIRTPLNAIINMGKALGETELDPFQQDCAETLSESANHLLGVVNNILDFSRLEAGRLTIEKVNFNLRKVLEYCVNTADTQLQGKPVHVRLETDGRLPQWTRGDPQRIRQILLNLMGNAVKFTSSGTITLNAQTIEKRPDGSMKMLFRVTDSGIGIPEQMLPGIFKRFCQADVSTFRMYGGSGLGLSICRQLVELMGGSIWVDSQEGKGSTFSFTLCLYEGVSEKAVDLAPATAHPPEDFEKLNVLMVEDNPFNVKVSKILFSKMGHSLTCEMSGREALERLRHAGFDLILTDIEMPEMDGFELTRLIRAGAGGPDAVLTPIVAISAHVGKAWSEKCRESGMDAYLTKPVEPAKLSAILKQFKKRDAGEPSASYPQPPRQQDKPVPADMNNTCVFFDLNTIRQCPGTPEPMAPPMRNPFFSCRGKPN